MDLQDQEILQTFVEESREHLADVESELLSAEAAGGQVAAEVINQVFRCVHSIKGGAGFLGLERVKELSHELENVVGLMRDGRLSPSPEIITVLLQAIDRLRELVEQVEQSNGMEIAVILASLQEVLEPSPPKAAPDNLMAAPEVAPELPAAPDTDEAGGALEVATPDGRVKFPVPVGPLAVELEAGRYIYLVEFDPAADARLQGQDAARVLPEIALGGEILAGSGPDGQPGEAPASGLPRFILFATLLDPDIVAGLLPVEERFIQNLTEDLRRRVADTGFGQAAAPPPETPRPEEAEVESPPSGPAMVPDPAPEPLEAGPAPPRAAPPAPGKPPQPQPQRPPAAPDPGKPAAAPTPGEKPPQETSLRVHVSLLDRLMTLAGELVLGRNQLMQTLERQDLQGMQNVAQKVNLVTSELQETVMLTRMQPVGLVFNKFPRVVRDLSRSLGKDAALTLEGQEVELDKTIIEGLHDPLTHLVRNAVDHGLEPPEMRRGAGKNPVGQIFLRAYHQAGQVNVEIEDDGRGLDPARLAQAAMDKGLLTPEQNRSMSDAERLNLILRPGFSTAEKVTEVSGRGVGMDVVKANLDRLGGQVEIDSRVGLGTTLRIKLPLTLAIIPCLIVSSAGERFAAPQVNVQELLRIPAHQVKDRLEKVGDAVVVRLRGQLLPVLPLSEVLGLKGPQGGPGNDTLTAGPGRNPSESRTCAHSQDHPGGIETGDWEAETIEAGQMEKDGGPISEMSGPAAGALCIAVVSSGSLTYGLVVDEFHGAEEIVIKPLGAHLKGCRAYAGATIMGDGRVALILDVANLAGLAGLTSLSGGRGVAESEQAAGPQKKGDLHSLLLFHQSETQVFAAPLFLVQRLERIKAAALERPEGQRVIQYQGDVLPVFGLEEVLKVAPLDGREDLLVLVFNVAGREVGLLAAPPVDTVQQTLNIDHLALKQPGVMGSAIINSHITLILDVVEFLAQIKPEWFKESPRAEAVEGRSPTILLAEDSSFFRSQVKRFLSEAGFRVVDAEDGLKAWELLQKHAEKVQLVVTDIEMPHLDGLGLTARIKSDQRFRHLPVIAVTSLAGEEDRARGRQAGVDDYQIKLDKEKLLESVTAFLGENR